MGDNALDPHVLLQALGYRHAHVLAAVGGGRDAALWRVACGKRTYALRVFPRGRADDTHREVAAMRAAAANGIPVPRVQAFELWQEHAVLLLDWCAGRTLLAAVQAQPRRAFGLGRAAGRELARIHRITAPAELRPWQQVAALGGTPLADRLTASPLARFDALLHLDYHPLNILVTSRGISAVLDWTNARAGDPRADLARAITILRLDAGGLPPVQRALVRLYELGLRRGYGPVDDLAPFHAWAGAFMLADLDHRATPAQRARITAWVTHWSRRAGVPG